MREAPVTGCLLSDNTPQFLQLRNTPIWVSGPTMQSEHISLLASCPPHLHHSSEQRWKYELQFTGELRPGLESVFLSSGGGALWLSTRHRTKGNIFIPSPGINHEEKGNLKHWRGPAPRLTIVTHAGSVSSPDLTVRGRGKEGRGAWGGRVRS